MSAAAAAAAATRARPPPNPAAPPHTQRDSATQHPTFPKPLPRSSPRSIPFDPAPRDESFNQKVRMPDYFL